mmetsp:Transcript_12941/g.25910  ORF Transcript_12941/g.25910 Transcript_12941/m.25910 type:complete len:219 (+) Transcript_12941:524-1180(+)
MTGHPLDLRIRRSQPLGEYDLPALREAVRCDSVIFFPGLLRGRGRHVPRRKPVAVHPRARHEHDPRVRALPEQRRQQPAQRVRPDGEVRREVALHARRVLRVGVQQHAGVADQAVHVVLRGRQLLGGAAHLRRLPHVRDDHSDAVASRRGGDLVRGGLRAGHVTAEHVHARTLCSCICSEFLSNAGVGASNHYHSVFHVGSIRSGGAGGEGSAVLDGR